MRGRHMLRIITLAFSVSSLVGCSGMIRRSGSSDESAGGPGSELETAFPERDTFERVDIGEDLYVRRVEAGAYVITHSFPWAGSSMLVAMGDSQLVLVDTPYTPEATRTVLEWAAAEFGDRHVVCINTGYHYDNLGGNEYLVQQGIPVYGSQLTAELLEKRGDEMRRMTLGWLSAPGYESYYDVHCSLPYVAPTHLFSLEEGLSLTIGGEEVQVYYPGPSHSPDNVVVYFPDRKILFGGCMIVGMDRLGNTADADLESWLEAVRSLYRFDFEVLVPGHGDRVDPGLLEHTIDLLTGNSQ